MKYEVDRKPLEQHQQSRTTRYRELAQNPEFISGIYNYCDRWCERCPFTSRCMNFALSDEQFGDLKDLDLKNEAFWERMAETLHATLEMVKEIATEQGIDLDTIDIEATMQEEKRTNEEARNHEVYDASEEYAKMVGAWFDAMNGYFENQEDAQYLEMSPTRTVEEDADLEDAVQVIRWYQHQIHVKLMRAVRGEMEETPEILADFPKDSDGSAKVALIGIDRSMSAWDKLLKIFPEQETDILNVLFHLERLRRNVERTFPNARAFVRPGFDEILYDG